MSQTQSRPITPDEFLAWEADQELKWEFDGFQPVAMTGGTRAHAIVQANLVTALPTASMASPVGPTAAVSRSRPDPATATPTPR
jgi:hypothetical protein